MSSGARVAIGAGVDGGTEGGKGDIHKRLPDIFSCNHAVFLIREVRGAGREELEDFFNLVFFGGADIVCFGEFGLSRFLGRGGCAALFGRLEGVRIWLVGVSGLRVGLRLAKGSYHLPLLVLGCVSWKLGLLVARWFDAQGKGGGLWLGCLIYTEYIHGAMLARLRSVYVSVY